MNAPRSRRRARVVTSGLLALVMAAVMAYTVQVDAGTGSWLPGSSGPVVSDPGPSEPGAPDPGYRATAEVPFHPSSPFRTPVPAGAHIDPDSPAVTGYLTREGRVYASMVEFGIPIYVADERTPRYDVDCLRTNWGPCPFDGRLTPVPVGAQPHTGSDGALVVVDEGAQRTYEFWQARRVGDRRVTSFGAVNRLNGSGWSGAATGAGASRLAGLVRLHEIERGQIHHALVMQTDNACAGVFRPPAIKTDGRSTRPDCVPQGARLRLDPAVDLGALDLSPAARTVARALQVYGAYVIDNGGAPLSISFELARDADGTYPGTVYRSAGLRWDYDGLGGIPWDRLQMLAQGS